MVCDSLNMCERRTKITRDGLEFTEVPNFCPWCGKKWFASAIPEDENNKEIQPRVEKHSGCKHLAQDGHFCPLVGYDVQ